MLAQIVLILAGLLILAGMVMVLLDAFSEGILWGILVLLLPPFAPVYCFIKWRKDQARNGFAMTLVGVTMVGVGLYGGGIHSIPILSDQEIVKNLPTALPDDEPLPNEALAAEIEIEGEGEYDPLLSDDKAKFSSSEIEALAPKEDQSVHITGRSKIRKLPLNLEDLGLAIGSNIEVTFIDGEVKHGNLITHTEDSLSLEEQIGSGFVSFEHNFKKIKSTALLIDSGKASPPPLVEVKEDKSKKTTYTADNQSNFAESKDSFVPKNPEELPSSE